MTNQQDEEDRRSGRPARRRSARSAQFPVIGPDYRPRAHDRVAMVDVDDQVVVGHEALGRLVVMDTVSAELYRLFDGIASVEELGNDLADATSLDEPGAQRVIERFCDALANDAFLADELIPRPRPRREHPWVPHDTCLGRKMGLSRAEFVQLVGDEGVTIRIGSTMPGVLGPLAEGRRTEPVDRSFLETIVLRASGRPGGASRLQQVFGTTGELLHASWNLEVAIDAFQRTINAALKSSAEGIWLQGVVVSRGGAALVLDTAFAGVVKDHLRQAEAAGIRWAPGIIAVRDGEVSWPDNPVTGEPAVTGHLRGIVLLGEPRPSTAEELIDAMHLARRWDQAHLDSMAALQRAGLVERWTPAEGDPADVIKMIEQRLA